jgi:monoterpene epsilon-lactone hydrolase
MSSLRSQILHTTLQRVVSSLDTRLSLQEQRTRIDALARRGIRLPKGITACSVQVDGVHGEWLEPQWVDPHKAILYLHGGGYCICSIDTHRGLAARIALSSNCRVLIIDYRLAPEHKYPAALEDALKSYHWLLRQGIDPEKIGVGGDSAGGGLTIATALSLRDAGKPLPAALFLISPWTDLTFTGESLQSRKASDPIFGGDREMLPFAPAYYGDHDPTDPLISPIFSQPAGLPPTLIQVGNDEMLLDDSTRMDEKLKEAGVDTRIQIWTGMWHVFQAFAPYNPESQKAIDEIGKFLQERIP